MLKDTRQMAEAAGIKRIFTVGYSRGADTATLITLGLRWIDQMEMVADPNPSRVTKHLISCGGVATIFALFTNSIGIRSLEAGPR